MSDIVLNMSSFDFDRSKMHEKRQNFNAQNTSKSAKTLVRKNRVGVCDGGRYIVFVNDYERIAQVIRYLDAYFDEQPSLEMVAAHVGLSPFHFHRLFSNWAGVTPKDFVQSLTLARARRLLQSGESVLSAAVQTGLSGPGRLHDLCITLEAASPGEVKSGGKGWRIGYGVTESPFGPCLIAESPRGICHLAFVDGETSSALDTLQNTWPKADLVRDDTVATRLGRQIFRRPADDITEAPLRAYVRGSSFQVRVWNALLRIPMGLVATYGQVAESIGQPEAARAVGTAVGSNVVGWLIPCHRVIRRTGIIGDYRWGADRKSAMLAWESAVSSISGSHGATE